MLLRPFLNDIESLMKNYFSVDQKKPSVPGDSRFRYRFGTLSHLRMSKHYHWGFMPPRTSALRCKAVPNTSRWY